MEKVKRFRQLAMQMYFSQEEWNEFILLEQELINLVDLALQPIEEGAIQ